MRPRTENKKVKSGRGRQLNERIRARGRHRQKTDGEAVVGPGRSREAQADGHPQLEDAGCRGLGWG